MPNWGRSDKIDTKLSVRNGGRGGVLDQQDWAETDVKWSRPRKLRDNILGFDMDFGAWANEVGRFQEAH